MRAVDLIEKKKQGQALSAEEIQFLIRGFTAGEIPDYQMAALAMAVCFQSMSSEETAALTAAMAESGEQVDLAAFGGRSMDKHSTGGVGDKTTLIVAPIAAACGGVVAKMSGRGLGHTGGTVDKLESIPGYQTELSSDQFMRQAEAVGLVVAGQSGNLAPADKKLYALRDVTATVNSIPLIASSIMSKKIAAGSKNIVLDVKSGSGAFMKSLEDAEQLAEEMVKIGSACGRRVTALITNMDLPLGNAIGNALEVEEALSLLRGEGPSDLREVCLALASEMIALSGDISAEQAREKAEQALCSGAALEKMEQWIAAQGGDLAAFKAHRQSVSLREHCVAAPCDGYLCAMDAESIGKAAMLLGAGRATKEDSIDYDAGMILLKKTGDLLKKGEPIARFYTADERSFDAAEQCYLQGLTFGAKKPALQPLILKKISAKTK